MFGSKKRARSWAHMPIKSAMKESDVPPCGRALMHGTAMLQPKSVFQQAKAEQGCCVTFLYLIFFFEVLAMIARPVAGGVQLYMANFNGIPHVSPRTREREEGRGVCVRGGADARARALRCAVRLNAWMGCGWGGRGVGARVWCERSATQCGYTAGEAFTCAYLGTTLTRVGAVHTHLGQERRIFPH